jgi:hypothetical protein
MDIEAPTGARYYGDLIAAPAGGIVPSSAYANTVELLLYQYLSGTWKPIYNLTAYAAHLLLETGDKLLLETGDKLQLE